MLTGESGSDKSLEEEEHERFEEDAGRSARREEIVVHSLRCECASSSTKFVVFTCPVCVAPVLRALEEVMRNGQR